MKTAANETELYADFMEIKREIDAVESRLRFVSEPKLVDALSFELLSLRARLGYTIDLAKSK